MNQDEEKTNAQRSLEAKLDTLSYLLKIGYVNYNS